MHYAFECTCRRLMVRDLDVFKLWPEDSYEVALRRDNDITLASD
jgi:hypothetical protein